MNVNILFWLFLCGHLIGDFYLQPNELVEKKKKKRTYVVLHGLIYLGAITILVMPVITGKLFIVNLIIFLSHIVVDCIKIKLNEYHKKSRLIDQYAFCADQLIHIAILVIVAYFYANDSGVALNIVGVKLLTLYRSFHLDLSATLFVKYFFVILVIGKPSNILIRELNKKESIKRISEEKGIVKKEETSSAEYLNAGKKIGILERMLIVILLILQQYAAIGLIFTAKSITRYDRITKEPAFAEYYLVGTLLSLLISVVAVLLIHTL